MSVAVVKFFQRMWSRLLHLYFRLTRGLTLGVRAVVISEDGKVLLVRHTYTPDWNFPGGGVEPGENAERALKKELWQETGLRLVGMPILQGILFNSEVSDHDHVLTYLCKTEGDILHRPPSLEIAELAYFNFENLPANTSLAVKKSLREIIEQPPSLNQKA